jgi:hypothetical protein
MVRKLGLDKPMPAAPVSQLRSAASYVAERKK